MPGSTPAPAQNHSVPRAVSCFPVHMSRLLCVHDSTAPVQVAVWRYARRRRSIPASAERRRACSARGG
eukprot:3399561-Rhodomonas_salina.2